MTREHRLILGLEEITSLRWTCHKCGVSVSYRLSETVRLPSQCPSCYDGLMDVEKLTEDAGRFVMLLKQLQRAKPQLLSLELTEDTRGAK